MNDIDLDDNDKQEVGVVQAKEFVRLLESGESIKSAAGMAGKSIAQLVRDPAIVAKIEELKQFHFASDEMLRWLVKTQMTKDMLEAEAPRDRQGAAKILIQDPGLGFNTDGVKIQINISDEVAKLDPGPMEWEDK